MTWVKALFRLVSNSARDLVFIVVVIAFFQLVVLRQPFPNLGAVVVGLLFCLFGLFEGGDGSMEGCLGEGADDLGGLGGGLPGVP